MVGHDSQQVVPGVDGVQSAPIDGEDDVDDGEYVRGPHLMMVLMMVLTMVIMCNTHHSLQRLYDGMPCSRPRWMFNDTRSIPNLAPGSWKGVWFESSDRLLVDC